MQIIKIFFQSLAVIIGGLTALLSILLFLKLQWPAPAWWFLKMVTSSLSPILVFIGICCLLTGLATGSAFISMLGVFNILIFYLHMFIVTRPPGESTNFDNAFGDKWEEKITAEQKNNFLRKRRVLKLPVVENARMEQNIPFYTIPGTDRKLLCDMWRPPENVAPSGLAFIYLHGAAWYILDKDVGTRPFFNYLASQGHVIMDVDYRLGFETDMMGMVHDAKRAITWMKENAATYGVNPDRIVIGGASSGAHLALMAAYTSDNPEFNPPEWEGQDIRVQAVVSFYGPTDLRNMYYHLNQHITLKPSPGQKPPPTEMPAGIKKMMGKEYYRLRMDKGFANAGSLPFLLGGHPDERPDIYVKFSPVTFVHADCPPTLMIHGAHDVMAPVESTIATCMVLKENNVPVVMHILPQTEHAFDMSFPKISPSTHNAIFDVERFLALMAVN